MRLIKNVLKERNLVIILFVLVFIAFAFAQNESKKIEKLYIGFKINTPSPQFTTADKSGNHKMERVPDNKKEFSN